MRRIWSRDSPLALTLTFTHLDHSPRLNANLLQRSEVVALINTLHRFSESLHAVEVFRRLWRESNAEQSAKLIREAEKAVNTPVSYYGYKFALIVDLVVAIPAIPTCQFERLICYRFSRSDQATSGALEAR